jgi:hypothetical protein
MGRDERPSGVKSRAGVHVFFCMVLNVVREVERQHTRSPRFFILELS